MTKSKKQQREFDVSEVEKLGMMGASVEELAAWFGSEPSEIQREMEDQNGAFRKAYEKGYGKLKISLRRQQIETARKGNVSMLIWLGKQLLEQSDKREPATTEEPISPTPKPSLIDFINSRKSSLYGGS